MVGEGHCVAEDMEPAPGRTGSIRPDAWLVGRDSMPAGQLDASGMNRGRPPDGGLMVAAPTGHEDHRTPLGGMRCARSDPG